MGKKDTVNNDLKEELNIDLSSEDGIEDILDTVLKTVMEDLSDLVSERFGKYIEPEIVEALVDAYEIDIYQDEQPLAAAIYSVFMKEYG